MDLSIIIINFNTTSVSLACIKSVNQFLNDIEYEIILVDNAPKSDYKAEFEFSHEGLKYIHSNENIGFGRANNLGMSIASGKYFLLLNSDTLCVDNSISKCFFFMEKNENLHVGMLGCKLLNEDGSYQGSYFPFIKSSAFNYILCNNPLLYKLFGVQRKFEPTNQTKAVGDISGAFMFLRRTIFEETKGFDPDFFLYCEETEWCRSRIIKHQDIYYYPEAQIIHLGGKSAPKDIMYVQSQISLAMYWYKKGWGNYLAYICFAYLNCLYFFLSYPFSKKEGKRFIYKHLRTLFLIIPYLFFNIPRYNKKYGSRPEGLIYEGARQIFFG
jgi:GT2 family glycosyltransferase